MSDRKLHPVLAELPVFAPGADLWPRIAAAHARRHRRRVPYRWVAIAAAAAAAVALGAAVVVPRWKSAAVVVDGPRESQALEREWRSLAASTRRPLADLARLHVIDAALQAAYDRGAQDDELRPLWKQRNQALRGLILVARTDTVTRI